MTTNRKEKWFNETIYDKKYSDGSRVWVIVLKTKR